MGELTDLFLYYYCRVLFTLMPKTGLETGFFPPFNKSRISSRHAPLLHLSGFTNYSSRRPLIGSLGFDVLRLWEFRHVAKNGDFLRNLSAFECSARCR